MGGIGLLILFAIGIAAFVVVVKRPHTKVRFSSGTARLVRGALPPGLLGDLEDVARGLPDDVEGTLGLHGQGNTLKLDVSGLEDLAAQRVRNVVLLRRRQIRRP